MPSRAELQKIFKNILGNNNVYFQPPEDIKISYPCILFRLNNPAINQANNKIYIYRNRYAVTIISKNPDDDLLKKFLEEFPYAMVSPRTIVNKLYHDNISILY